MDFGVTMPLKQCNPNQQQQQQPQQQQQHHQPIEYQSNDISQSRPNIIRSNRNGNKRTALTPDTVLPKPITLVLIKTLLPSDGNGHH